MLNSPGKLSPIQRLKLLKELSSIRIELPSTKLIAKLKMLKRLNDLRILLGAGKAPIPPIEQPVTDEEKAKTLTQRQRANNAAIEALARVQGTGEKDAATVLALKGYSGSGGGLKTAQGTVGSPHEYYTPAPIAKAMWGILNGLGFTGGRVLDPSAGMGIFARTKPDSVAIEQIELDSVSGEINGILNNSPTIGTRVASFEEVAASTDDETFDAVVTNVPFGDKSMRGAHWRKDKRYQNASLQEYFILRGLEKVKPGGFAAFIVPASVVSGKGGKGTKLRSSVSMMAEFVGAYRLPNMVFDEAGADTITDILLLRKHGKANKQKIDEIAKQNATLLTDALVMWSEFLDGNYFLGDGKRFQLGEATTGMGRFGEVQKVANTGTIESVANLIRPFPKTSRINWELLGATETAPIVILEGDIVFSSGATLKMEGGKLVPVEGGASNDDASAVALLEAFTSPINAITQGLTFEDATRAVLNEQNTGRVDMVQRWLLTAQREAAKQSNPTDWFNAIVAGMAVQEFALSTGSNEPRNYLAEFPELSRVLTAVQSYAKKKSANPIVKAALQSIAVARIGGVFTHWWQGQSTEIKQEELTLKQTYDRVMLDDRDGGYIDISLMREASPSFDPLNDDEWCVSPDGKGVMSHDDYYAGTYKDFLERAALDLEQAADPAIKEKILRQQAKASDRLARVDVSRLRFSLETAMVSPDKKLEFLKGYLSSEFALERDDSGQVSFRYTGKTSSYATPQQERHMRALRRFAVFLNNGRITTGTKQEVAEANPQEERALLTAIKDIVAAQAAQFDVWCKSDPQIVAETHDKLNHPSKLRFIETPNFAPVDIPNWNPAWVPHGYQNGSVRKFAKKFSGILGLDVGLGKTLTALATAQYVQSLGLKKRTAFVVPASTFTNWHKETSKAYLDTSACLFVGFAKNKDGKFDYSPAKVDADINKIRGSSYTKIYMTYESFARISLRAETLEEYRQFLLSNDDAFFKVEKEGEKKRTSDKIASESALEGALEGGKKSGGIPYFEDLGIDSIVLDECHGFKNSKTISSDFKQTKFVARPENSQRGTDMQSKCWYLRHTNPSKDGVMALTATPVTNSPIEVYSMMALAIGESEMNQMCGVTGADSFMKNACGIDHRDEENIVGQLRNQRVLEGIDNLDIIRRVLDAHAVIETAETVAAKGIFIAVPESEEVQTSIELEPRDINLLINLKQDYLDASAAKAAGGGLSQREAIMAAPFNVIRKMTKLIADRDLHEGVFKFTFATADKAKAQQAVDAFNKKKVTEERKEYELPDSVDTSTFKSKEVFSKDDGVDTIVFYVPIIAEIKGLNILLPGINYDTHDKMMAAIEKAGLGVSMTASPKMAAMLANLEKEHAHPRGKPAKQLIFCDELALHHKLRILVAQSTGIPLAKIKIVNAASVSTDELQGVQDGFNANEDDNRYQIIIANKKAEVGINLQNGTQAIHHLTIGWTPDSLHQRNGRGVRQGNKLDTPVMIYHYDANGTFDSYKRRLVGIKGDWISSLMDKSAAGVTIEGAISAEDEARMASMIGDSAGMARFNEEMAAKAKRQTTESAKLAQINAISVATSRKAWLSKFEGENGFYAWMSNKHAATRSLESERSALSERLSKTSSEDVAKSITSKIALIDAKIIEGQAVYSGSGRNTLDSFKETDAAVVNWTREVTINRKMLNEARAAQETRTSQGYSAAALAKVDDGSATVIGGKLIAVGDFVTASGKPGIVKVEGTPRNGKVFTVVTLTNDGVALVALAGLAITVAGSPGDADYATILKQMVAHDEAALTAGSGVALFSGFSAIVRSQLSVAMPGKWMYGPNRREKLGEGGAWIINAPEFPYVLRKEAESGALSDVYAAQSAFIERKEDGHSSMYRFKDARKQVDDNGRDPWEAAASWLTANGKKMTFSEAGEWIGAGADEYVKALFESAQVGICEKAGSIAQLDAAVLAWFAANVPWISDNLSAQAVADKIYVGRAFEAMRNKVDDGREPYYRHADSYKLTTCDAFKQMTAAIAGRFADGALNAELMQLMPQVKTQTQRSYQANAAYSALESLSPDVFKQYNEVVLAAIGGELKAEGTVSLESSQYHDALRQQLQFGAGAKVMLDTLAIFCGFKVLFDPVAAYAVKQAQSSLGVDIDGFLSALKSRDDVGSATIGANDYFRPKDPWVGAFAYTAGTYIVMMPRFNSDLAKEIAVKNAGLKGRHYNRQEGGFFINATPGLDSKGDPVADFAALAKLAGMDKSTYESK